MAHQDGLTILAPVAPGRVSEVDAALTELRANPAHNAVLSFGLLEGCHFGRVLLLPAGIDLQGRAVGAQLLLLTDCDGDADAQLERIVDVAGAGLDRLIGPTGAGRPATRDSRLRYLRRQRLRVAANYVHRQGRTVAQIRDEARLRAALQEFVGRDALRGLAPLEARTRIQDYLRRTPELAWALRPAAGLGVGFRARRALDLLGPPLALGMFAPLVVPSVLALLLAARLQEQTDPTDTRRPTREHVRELFALEELGAQSGFTAVGYLKPGPVRRAVLASVLPLIGWGSRHLFRRDSLAGVKTIHFARWIPIDGSKRVVFCSNYDGSLESYNNDFIDLVSWGLNLIFSNGYGWPRTRWLVFGGATREQEFKDFLRARQVPTPVWYSAYPTLSARNVARNARLRAGLSGSMGTKDAQAWLRLL